MPCEVDHCSQLFQSMLGCTLLGIPLVGSNPPSYQLSIAQSDCAAVRLLQGMTLETFLNPEVRLTAHRRGNFIDYGNRGLLQITGVAQNSPQ